MCGCSISQTNTKQSNAINNKKEEKSSVEINTSNLEKKESSEIDQFTGNFYNIDNIIDYIKCMDSVIDSAESKPGNSIKALQQGKNIVSITTNNHVHMAYSITYTNIGFVALHVSFSRPPYMATPFGKYLVVLFLKRSGWPAPNEFLVSKNRVYHAGWIFNSKEYEAINKESKAIRSRARLDTDYETMSFITMIESSKLPEPAGPIEIPSLPR